MLNMLDSIKVVDKLMPMSPGTKQDLIDSIALDQREFIRQNRATSFVPDTAALIHWVALDCKEASKETFNQWLNWAKNRRMGMYEEIKTLDFIVHPD